MKSAGAVGNVMPYGAMPYHAGAGAQPENTIRVSIQQPQEVVTETEEYVEAGPSFLAMVISLVLALVFIVVGLILAFKKLKQSAVADATLSRVNCNQFLCTMNLTFKDKNNRTILITGHRVHGFSYRDGQIVSIRYDPENPAFVSINFLPYWSKYAFGWILLLLGVALLAYGVWALLTRMQQA